MLAAKQGDRITATDTHIVMVPSAAGPQPQMLPHPFSGIIDGGLSHNVRINGRPAAVVGSTATNMPPHTPTSPGISFQSPPTNRGTITKGSSSVRINGRPAARTGDAAQTCADPAPNPNGRVIVTGGNVRIGG